MKKMKESKERGEERRRRRRRLKSGCQLERVKVRE